MKKKFGEKLLSLFSIFSIFVQVASPFSLVNFASVFAQDVSPTETVAPTPTSTETVSPTDSPTPTEIATPTPSDTIVPTVEATPTPSETIEATVTPSEVVSPTDSATSTNQETTGPPGPTATPGPSDQTSPTPTVAASVLSAKTGNEHVDTQVIESNSCFANSLNGCLTTDKPDYHPTEVVLISGYGFLPNTNYELRIISDNLDQSFTVKTDENGAFSYSYQLDGTYRPNYTVELRDLTGVVVATTTFTDSPPSGCINDADGANDEPGQKDLNKMCVNYSGLPTSLAVSWNWDEIGWTGNNTGDACSLFDTDADGLANYALCVQVHNTPATYDSKFLYSCGDTAADKCTSSVLLSPSVGTTCNASVQADDPFLTGDSYPSDTVASCTVQTSDVGGSSSALLDVCSYPSEQPNSDPSDCIVASTAAQTGTLTVVKDLIPSNDSGLFNLQIDSTTYASDVGDGGTTGPKIVDAGNHTVGETAGTSTSLSNYTSAIACVDNSNTIASSSNSGPLTVNVANGHTVVCTITNTVNNGHLIVQKTTIPGGNQTTFSITATGSGTIVNGASGSVSDSTDHNYEVTPGTYSVSETVPSGWDKTGDTCQNVVVPAGQTVNCLLTNTKRGHIIVDKITDPSGSSQSFDFTATGSGYSNFSLTDTDSPNNQEVVPGSYSVSETAVAGWDSDGGVCDMGETPASLDVGAGETVTCTFTNTQKGSITVNKDVDTDGDGTVDVTGSTDWTWGLGGNTTDYATGSTQEVSTGTYKIEEGIKDGFHVVDLVCDSVSYGAVVGVQLAVDPGQDVVCTFTNARDTGSLQVNKEVDTDADGEFEGGNTEANNLGFVWGLDSVTPARAMGSTASTLPTGSYEVDENTVTGYHFTGWYYTDGDGSCENPDETELPASVDISTDSTTSITLCNAHDTGNIRVVKDIDGNNDGDLNDAVDQTNVAGWTWDISGGEQNITMGDNRTLVTGNYTITEDEKPDDYAFVSWSCSNGTNGTTNNIPLSLNQGDEITCDFINTPVSDVHGFKWDDINGNGKFDRGEDRLGGWIIFIDKNGNGQLDEGEQSSETPSEGEDLGWYWFFNLLPGEYRICEVNRAGWVQTYPSDPNCHVITLPESGESTQNAVFAPEHNFGNQRLQPLLTISKSNNASGDKAPGDNVTFTLTVTATQSSALNVVVTDLPAGGFTYRAGSWTATKNGLPFSVPEPVYHSPGKWQLGNLNENDVVVLTYVADISGSIASGLYRDNAWASGCNEATPDCSVGDGNSVIASAVNPGKLSDNFVGTAVNIVQSPTLGYNVKREETGQVLGASTSLPATGAKTLWVILASILLIFGAGFVTIGLLMRKRFGSPILKLLGIVMLFLVLTHFGLSAKTYAADPDNVSIRFEQPASPTTNNTFDINFVTLDIFSRPITVKCFKKGPSDGVFSQFGGDIAVAAGGNSGNCSVNSSVMSTNGTYQFYATATAGAGPGNSAQSETIAIDFNVSGGPGTPISYQKSQPDSCKYEIKFRTADDGGKTVKVEIYRSSETSFNADAGTRITTIAVGSNEEKIFTDTIPVCGKTYYYVIRAFDSAGNGSGLIGDTVVTVTTTTTTSTTTGQAPAAGGGGGSVLGTQTTGGAIPVTNVTLPQPTGEVKGEATPSGAVEVTTAPKGGVAGAMTKLLNKANRPWILIIVVVILGAAVYVFIKRKPTES